MAETLAAGLGVNIEITGNSTTLSTKPFETVQPVPFKHEILERTDHSIRCRFTGSWALFNKAALDA